MSVAESEVDVLIVGGGPVGLTARALLERWGVRTLLVEKHRALSPFPRSRLVNVRTMEIFRQLGLAEAVTAAAFAPEFGRVRFRDTLRSGDFASAAMIGLNAPIPDSPVLGVVSSQDRLEPVLLGAADAPVAFGVELIDLAAEPAGVWTELVDHRRGTRSRVRAHYVLAADGANSTVRQRLGIPAAGPGAIGDSTTVVFDADLNEWRAEQPAGVYMTTRGSFTPLYPEGGWAWIGTVAEEHAPADWHAIVAAAIGPGRPVEVDVLRVQHWTVNAFVAERFHDGRVLLAGDAAHAVPPAGGLGMNAGIGDVHNLCWKLAGVLSGWADASLLETYAVERLPVAHRTLDQAVANSRLMRRTQQLRQEVSPPAATTSPEMELPWSEQYFAQLGLVLGVVYRSAAVLAHGESDPPEPGTDYRPTPEPGHRMPHLWLSANRSTLDAVGEHFTVFTADPALWRRQRVGFCPLRVEALTGEQAELFRLDREGALLVRPDDHIAAVWTERPSRPDALGDALAAIAGTAEAEPSRRSGSR
ncbi:FAD-dependent monooxygenase [Nocardia sp. CDC153]|uniref:FAD-dependent monooxygenase n=1 Tax=Nocardia sp. CDC153 TaxID=3112167 RepID=UPI002DB7A6C0|nr:FAD-dependent monooxygenase [Nocardia sp. CDC153]MEC3956969.1 FAD-dependent monooxygenase [Nocardia sp. CDC153]